MPLSYLAVDASASIRGLVNTTTQTFAGSKTFNNLVTLGAGLTISSGTITFTGFSGVLTASAGVITSSSALGVALGGTNISSYTAGDMLYASGSTTLSKLGIGSTNGAIMMSNGSSAPSWVTSIPATITFSNGATISGGTFALNTNETCSLTTTTTAPSHGRADVDLWQPSGAPSTDFYAYYQQVEYANNQANTFGIAGMRSDAITTAALTSATIARVDSFYSLYSPLGAGTVTQATGLRVTQISALSGTTTNYIGVRVENNVSSGTITNATGLYIDTIGGKGGTTGASIYLVSDGTAKTGVSWGTSTSAYTADVGLYRSGAGALAITGTATISNGLVVNNAKTTLAATATGYASLNLPSGTSPSSPASGDLWWDGTHLYFYNGSSNVNLLAGALTGSGATGQVTYWSGTSAITGSAGFTYASNQLTVSGASGSGIIDTVTALATTSTQGFALQNTTASTSGATQQQSPGFDYIGHAWNTTPTAADNFVRLREELQVTSGAVPTGTFVWKTSVDTGTASFVNRMTLTTNGLLTVSNGLTITSGSFTIGSNTLALSSSSTLSLNSQTLTMTASIGNFTIGAGTGTSATTHNFVQSGTTQYVLESATAPTALGDMYYASTTSYATMSKLSIGSRGSVLVANTATPTPTWLAPSSTAGVALVSAGTGADLAFGTVLVAGGGTGQTTFSSTNSLLVTGSSSTGAFATVTGAAGLLYTTAANTAPTFVTSVGTLITFSAGITVTGAKTTVAATATGYASLNLPSGTVPTSPSSGDTYYDGTILWFYDGTTAKRINKKQAVIVMCSAFTPGGTGADVAEFTIPYKGDGTTSITWNARRFTLRAGTAGGAPVVVLEKSTASTAFSATSMGTLTMGSGANEGSITSFSPSTVASGDKVRFNVSTLATATNWTITLELEEA
jgi:hypothetical protein